MDDEEASGLVADDDWIDGVERAVLSDTPEGRTIAAAFIHTFGEFVTGTVRPILRDVAQSGGEPQLLVNGLAQMLRDVAATVEFPVADADADRDPVPPPVATDDPQPDPS